MPLQWDNQIVHGQQRERHGGGKGGCSGRGEGWHQIESERAYERRESEREAERYEILYIWSGEERPPHVRFYANYW
jgi:hypothetical protein